MNLLHLAFTTILLLSPLQVNQIQTTTTPTLQTPLTVRESAPKLPDIATSTSVTVLDAIGKCESQNNPHIKNTSSSASGRFQFLWGTWNHYGHELWGDDFYEKNIFSYKDSTDLASYVIQKYGTSDWNESKSCWSLLVDE